MPEIQEKMNIHFEPGPYERKISYGRIVLPQEYMQVIKSIQKKMELACVTRDEMVTCYPLAALDDIVKLRETPNLRNMCSARIKNSMPDGALKDLFSDFNRCRLWEIHPQGLYVPKQNFLRKFDTVSIEGHTNYFEIRPGEQK